ncbi:DUF937 domain-containing protein [uncultured Deinococcus sp.]|uniref:DUF937 domain-containing protein n=1 Tax=uncultured Deinococcus sp. TaxID=158789 RepID=UPI002584B749|nr:DUF937 domain-containing protein [uncultured Deinococcus sp.]
MMDLFSRLGGMGQAQGQISSQLGTDPQQTSSALEAAVPLLLGALTRNAAQPGGMESLTGALNQHDGRALDLFQQGQMPDMRDGQAIVGKIFGGQGQAAANAVSQRSGLSPQLAMQVLSMLAPLVLAYLSRQRGGQGGGLGQGQSSQGGGLGDLGGLLGGLLGGGGSGGLGGLLGGLLGGGHSQGQSAPQMQTQRGSDQWAGGQGGSLFPGSAPAGSGQGGDMGSAQNDLDQLNGRTRDDAQQTRQPQPQPQGGDLLSTLNRTLDRDGDGNALNDLIGMFGGRR